MTNYFQIEKYNKNICQTERKKYLLKRMPKIQIKSLKNEDDLENFKKIPKRKSIVQNEKEKSEKKENKILTKIPMNLFRRMLMEYYHQIHHQIKIYQIKISIMSIH